MALSERLRHLLDRGGARYEIVPHREAFTALEIAQASHIAGRKLAKVVVVRDTAGSDFMVVLPSARHLDRSTIRHLTGRHGIRLESETELRRLFPDCEVGAMPPFGGLYGLNMYVDPCFAEEDEIYFQAGNHHELVRMRWEDYARLAAPFFGDTCLHRELTATGG